MEMRGHDGAGMRRAQLMDRNGAERRPECSQRQAAHLHQRGAKPMIGGPAVPQSHDCGDTSASLSSG